MNISSVNLRKIEQTVAAADLKPSFRKQLNMLWNNMEDDILALSSVLYYAEERVFNGKVLPSVIEIFQRPDILRIRKT